jgi:hypothetical protein
MTSSNFTLSKRELDVSTDTLFPQSTKGRMDHGPSVATNYAAPFRTTGMNMSNRPPQDLWKSLPGPTHAGARPTREEVLNILTWDKEAGGLQDQSLPNAAHLNGFSAGMGGYPASNSFMVGMNQSRAAPASPGFNPDHVVEFELQTSMGMVWRPSSEQLSQYSASSYDMGMLFPTDVGSPSQCLEFQDPPLFNNSDATIPDTQGPNDDLGCAGLPTNSPVRGLDQTLQNLERLEVSLQAHTRMQMNYIDDDRRKGLLQ